MCSASPSSSTSCGLALTRLYRSLIGGDEEDLAEDSILGDIEDLCSLSLLSRSEDLCLRVVLGGRARPDDPGFLVRSRSPFPMSPPFCFPKSCFSRDADVSIEEDRAALQFVTTAIDEFSPRELQHTIEIHKVVVRDLSSGSTHNDDDEAVAFGLNRWRFHLLLCTQHFIIEPLSQMR